MAKVQRTVLTLRFTGDDLDPQEITDRLGVAPTSAFTKGATLASGHGPDRVAKTGQWQLTLEGDVPDDFEKLTDRLFHQLTADEATWLDLSQRFAGDLFVGLFLSSTNEGVDMDREALVGVAARGLGLRFDIYGAAQT